MECDWKDIRSVAAFLIHITQLHLPSFVIKRCGHIFGYIIDTIFFRRSANIKVIRRSTVECDWKNTGDYWSVVEVIDAHSLAPPTREESHDCCFSGHRLCSFLFSSREEETPIARAVSSSLCVCAMPTT